MSEGNRLIRNHVLKFTFRIGWVMRRAASIREGKQRNIVILCLDTVRKDTFDRRARRLSALADVSFENCRAASGWSVPSHASMLTGKLPSEHDVHALSPQLEEISTDNTLLGDLPAHAPLGVSANVYAGSAFGFDTHFDVFIDISRDQRYHDALDVPVFVDNCDKTGIARYVAVLHAALRDDRPMVSLLNAAGALLTDLERSTFAGLPSLLDDGAATVERAVFDLIDSRDEPFVLFVNFMEAHEPHRDTLWFDRESYTDVVPRGWDSMGVTNWDVANDSTETEVEVARYRALYDAAVTYLDRRVSAFIERLLTMTGRETTVIITADHGENLALPADEGTLGHVTSLSEGILHVPLVLVNPPRGYDSIIDEYVSHLSLRRLVTGLARGLTPDVTEPSPVAEVVGVTPGNETLVEQNPDRWDRMLRCAYENDRKYVWDHRGEEVVYALDQARPSWQERLDTTVVPDKPRDRFPGNIARYRCTAKSLSSDDNTISDAVEHRLRDLGYRHDSER